MPLETVKTITSNMQYKNFTPPVDEFKLGREALRKGLTPQPTWTERMKAGWDFEGQRCYALAMTEAA